MQTLYVPKYKLTYRVNPQNPCELQWSKKPFGPMTSWQHAYTFSKPIRALDTDDQTGQGVVVLNDSSTYVGSGVRVWGKKFYTAGSRIYSLYSIGESKMTHKLRIKVHEKWDASADKHTRNEYRTEMQRIVNPLSKGFFHDTDWSAVWKIRNALKDAFPQVKFELGANDGGYNGNTKVYNLVATTPEGFELNGRIKCFAAGTTDAPFDRYDMTVEIY